MPAKSWDLYHEGAIPTHATFAHAELADVSVVANRLVGGLSDGVDVVSVRNGKLEISIIPTRGMGIGDMSYDGQRIGWQSPVPGPVHPALVNLSDPSGLGWLDGFDELLVRCGLESNGAPEFDEAGTLKYPLHGRIANRPAQQVKISIDPKREQVAVTGIVDETRFHFTKLRLTSTLTTRVGDKGFSIIDRVENLSESSSECQLLYHINIGLPFLESGARIVAPIKKLVPRDPIAARGADSWNVVARPTARFEEEAYYLQLLADNMSQTQLLLQNRAASQGIRLKYNIAQLPCFTLWKNSTAVADGYVVGLEPATNFPNCRGFERAHGRVVELGPRSAMEVSFRVDYLASSDEVTTATKAIQAIQGNQVADYHAAPEPQWCQSPC